MSTPVEKKRCMKCQRFFKPPRKTSLFCSVSCASQMPRIERMSVKEILERKKHLDAVKKSKLRKRLLESMKSYWYNYENGMILGSQRKQVAPILSYLPRHTVTLFGKIKFRKIDDMVKSPEDLAYLKDPEGVLLGKYDF